MVGKRLVNTGGAAAAAFDPLQNFETVTYTGNGGTQKITGYIRKGAAFNGSSSKIDLANLGISGADTRTISAWVNVNSLSSNQTIFQFGSDAAIQRFGFAIDTSGKVYVEYYGRDAITSSAHITVGTWFHVAVTYNGGAIETATNTQIYVNGSAVSMSTTGTSTGSANTTDSNYGIGYRRASSNQYFNGKIDQVRIFNTALNSTQVGQLAAEDYTDPKKSTTDYFGNGSGVALYELDEDANDTGVSEHYVFIADAGGLLTDVRINTISSEFTYSAPSGYSDFGGALQTSNGYNESLWNITESNKRATKNDSYYHSGLITQNSYSSGKYYLELEFLAADLIFGVTKQSDLTQLYFTEAVENMIRFTSYTTSVFAYSASNTSSDGQALSSNDVIGLAIDYDNKELHYYVNNTLVTTQNLAGYDGTPTNVNFLGMAFQPDLVWVKSRNHGYSHHIQDVIRGAGPQKDISSDGTWAEGTFNYGSVDSFDANGFTVGSGGHPTYGRAQVNESGKTYVAWCWKAAGAAVSNTDGTITSQVSANPDAGFSIVDFTAAGGTVNARLGHGLSSAPELIIYKAKDAVTEWYVLTTAIDGSTDILKLNKTDAKTDDSSIYLPNSTTISNIVFAGNWISYCFHSVDGYQKVGSYEGNGTSKDIVTGFEPRFLLMKNADNATGNWVIFDSTRGVNQRLFPDLSNAENTITTQLTSFNSDGFSVGSNTNVNGLNNTIIYLAIA